MAETVDRGYRFSSKIGKQYVLYKLFYSFICKIDDQFSVEILKSKEIRSFCVKNS
jgi:hypothetical protein